MPVCNRWPILPASPRRFSSGSYVRSDIPIQTSSIIPKKRSLRRFELSTGAEMGRKTAFWAEYGGGGWNGGQTCARNARAARCTGGAAGVRALPAVGTFLLRRGATHPPCGMWADTPDGSAEPGLDECFALVAELEGEEVAALVEGAKEDFVPFPQLLRK